MKRQNKYPDVTQFSNLEQKLATAKSMCEVNNMSAQVLYEQTGQIVPRYDADAAMKAVTKAHNRFYGLSNKYA